MKCRRPQVLLVTDCHAEVVGTTQEHVRTLVGKLKADVFKVDRVAAGWLNLAEFDVIILHYSVVIASSSHIKPAFAAKLKAFNGPTIVFIQDEYRWIDRTAAAMRDLSVDVVFSLIDPSVVRQVYHHPWCERIRFEHTLTGFVPDDLAKTDVVAYEQRELDVGYRARKLWTWFGRHAEQKWRIAERFAKDAERFGLKVDIATDEASRIYGPRWIDFLKNCRAVLGTESGVSVCDFTGEIQENVERYVANNPNTSGEEIHKLYIGDADGKIVMNVISPRCFEAAALRTLMIMYPGEYNGILQAGRHYVMLQPDHSNIEEVVEILHSPERAKQIIQTTYEEIVLSGRWSHDALAAHVNRVMYEMVKSPVAPDLTSSEIVSIYLRKRALPARLLMHRMLLATISSAARAVWKLETFAYNAVCLLPPSSRDVVLPSVRKTWHQFKYRVKRHLS